MERRREIQNAIESEAYYSITEQPFVAQHASIRSDNEESKANPQRIKSIA